MSSVVSKGSESIQRVSAGSERLSLKTLARFSVLGWRALAKLTRTARPSSSLPSNSIALMAESTSANST